MKKILHVSTKIFGLFVGIFFLFSFAANATDWYVSTSGDDATGNGTAGKPWRTIQHAVNDATVVNGDVINVGAGTYNETISVNKNITLKGANAGINAVNGSRNTETLLTSTPSCISLSTGNTLTVDGFQFNGRNFVAGGTSNSLTVNNCKITTDAPEGSNCVYVGQPFTNFTVQNNDMIMTSNCQATIQPVGNYTGSGPLNYVNISGNRFTTTVAAPGDGVRPVVVNLADVQGDVSENNFDGVDIGVLVANGSGNLTIEKNIFNGLVRSASDHSGNSYGAGVVLFQLTTSAPAINIINNYFQNSDVGVRTSATSDFSSHPVTIHNNSFTNNQFYHLRNAATSGTFDATCNWYGTTNNSTIALKIYGSVTYIPYLTNGTDSDPSTPGFQPVAGSCNGTSKNWYVNDTYSSANDHYTIAQGNDATGDGSSAKPYRTINKAMSVASNGDNIYVDAGSYMEYINVTKSLNFYGSNANVSGQGSRLSESIINLALGAPEGVIFEAHTPGTDIQINGFKLTNGKPLTDGHYHRNPTQDIVIMFRDNFIMKGGNLFAGSLTQWKTVSIIDNYFNQIDITGTSSAIQLNDANDGYAPTATYNYHAASMDVIITDNKIDGTGFAGILLDNIKSAMIQRNFIKSTPGDAAIQLAGGMGSATVSENDIRNANTNNLADGAAIRIYGADFSNTGLFDIRNNVVTNSINGFAVKNGEDISGKNIHVKYNSFNNTVTGKSIYHGGVGQLDATCNWHGANPPVAGRVVGPVDYIPYLTSGTDADAVAIGFQPLSACNGYPAGGIYVNDGSTAGDVFTSAIGNDATGNGSQSKPYRTINKAVSVAAASGSVIYVDAGTYQEQVLVVTKSLTIWGAGVGNTNIVSPAGALSFRYSTNVPIVYFQDAVDVIKNLTVNGQGNGNLNNRFQGIAYRNAGGTVQNCEIKAIRNTPIDGVQAGVGLYDFTDNGTARTLNVLQTSIYDFQKNATVFAGADLTVNITTSTITGAGAIDFTAQNGVQISNGATGSITHNTISGFSYTPATTAVASAVLVFGPVSSPVTTSANTINDAQQGIYYIGAAGTISNNYLTNNAANMGTTPTWWAIESDDLTTTVTGNEINNGGNGTGIEADYFSGETTNMTATNNKIDNSYEGFAIYTDGSGGTAAVTMNSNSITTISNKAIHNYGVIPQDGTCNWFGSASNAVIIPLIQGPVNYNPWLTNGTDNAPATLGFQPIPGSCNGTPALNPITVISYDNADLAVNTPFNVRIFSNPSANGFTLKIESSNNESIKLNVVDMAGRLVTSSSKVAANTNISFGSNFKSGVYFAQIKQGNNYQIVKLVKIN